MGKCQLHIARVPITAHMQCNWPINLICYHWLRQLLPSASGITQELTSSPTVDTRNIYLNLNFLPSFSPVTWHLPKNLIVYCWTPNLKDILSHREQQMDNTNHINPNYHQSDLIAWNLGCNVLLVLFEAAHLFREAIWTSSLSVWLGWWLYG